MPKKKKNHTQSKESNLSTASHIKRKTITIIKFLFVIGLMLFLIKKGFISIQAMQQALRQWQKISIAAIGLFLCTFLGIARWQLLLKAQNIHIAWKRAFQLTMVGNFFNIALPGAVSGDFVKAFYIGREIKGHRSKAFGSILFDRVTGVSALVLVSAGALTLGLGRFFNSQLLHAIQFIISLGAVSVLLFYSYLFLVREKHDPLLHLFRTIEKKIPAAGSLTRIYESIRHYHSHRITVLKSLGISILIHLVTGWSCLLFAHALGDHELPLLASYVVVPLGLLVTAIPVAPAGIGTGNIAFLYFFHLIGSERGADIYSLVALTNLIIGAMGGIFYFRFKSHATPEDLIPIKVQTPTATFQI